jgi:hypothetical protein
MRSCGYTVVLGWCLECCIWIYVWFEANVLVFSTLLNGVIETGALRSISLSLLRIQDRI